MSASEWSRPDLSAPIQPPLTLQAGPPLTIPVTRNIVFDD